MINNNWVFGNNTGLDFSNANATTLPVAKFGYSSKIYEGCAAVSDTNGRLLFYTDGINIWYNPPSNINSQPSNLVNLMTPPTSFPTLKGDPSSTQSSIIVPDPANNQRYYIFTTDGATGTNPNNHFGGSMLDLSGAAPILTPVTIPNYPGNRGRSPVEKLTAVQKNDCSGYWVIVAVQESSNLSTNRGPGLLRVFDVTTSGIRFEQEYALKRSIEDGGYMKVSPDASLIALTTGQSSPTVLYNFDNTTGVIDTSTTSTINVNVNTIPNRPPNLTINYIYGLEFSPDSKLLYLGSLTAFRRKTPGYIFQVGVSGVPAGSNLSASFVGSIQPISTNNRYTIGALQTGPDGRIYIAKDRANSLGVIMQPNAVGIACDVQDSAIDLGKGISQLGLPNLLPNPCADDAPCDCDCSCTGCNEDADVQNQELIDRAQSKFNTVPANENLDETPPFQDDCNSNTLVTTGTDFTPSFYFHWGDGTNDQIEEHDTEVFYLTVCNRFEDVRYEGLRITSVTLVPDIEDLDRIHIVPDRFISLDCLEPCSCQTREFALITRGNDTAGAYTLEVDYCYEGIALASSAGNGTATFPVEITED